MEVRCSYNSSKEVLSAIAEKLVKFSGMFCVPITGSARFSVSGVNLVGEVTEMLVFDSKCVAVALLTNNPTYADKNGEVITYTLPTQSLGKQASQVYSLLEHKHGRGMNEFTLTVKVPDGTLRAVGKDGDTRIYASSPMGDVALLGGRAATDMLESAKSLYGFSYQLVAPESNDSASTEKKQEQVLKLVSKYLGGALMFASVADNGTLCSLSYVSEDGCAVSNIGVGLNSGKGVRMQKYAFGKWKFTQGTFLFCSDARLDTLLRATAPLSYLEVLHA